MLSANDATNEKAMHSATSQRVQSRSVAAIQVREGQFVDQIRLTYREGTVRRYGKNTGCELTGAFVLDDDEYIIAMRFKQGRQNLKELQIFTNKRESRKWGKGDPNRAWERVEASESNPIVDVVSAVAEGYCPRIEGCVRLKDPPASEVSHGV